MSTENEEKMVTVQGTKKALKVHLLVAWFLIALAIILIVNASGVDVVDAGGVFLLFCGAISLILTAFGAALWLIISARAWWYRD